MIVVNTNMNQVVDHLLVSVNRVASQEGIDKMLRNICFQVAGDMAHRIHTDGQKADGSQIGTYSPEYMKVRTGQFTTNKTFLKGKNKGATKPTGVFTKGKNKGKPRPNYNRTSDPKIVFSLTRQMENDFSIKSEDQAIRTATGYGIGFKNQLNADKSGWLEEKHPGTYKLSENEKQKVRNITEYFIENAFK